MNGKKRSLLKYIGIEKPVNEITSDEWNTISFADNLSEEFIREFKNEVFWDYISKHQNLSENFIIEFEGYVFWDYICKYQKLSEGFIREHQDKVDWDNISCYQKLPDDFLLEFNKMINWHCYFSTQVASYLIMRKFILKSYCDNIEHINNSKLNNAQKQEIDKLLSLKYIFEK